MELFQYDPQTSVESIKNPIDNKNYLVYNVSKGKDNYSQLRSQYSYKKNEFHTNKYSFCNVTMMGMALIYLGYEDLLKSKLDKIYPEFPRLPDKLIKFIIEDPKSLTYFKERFPDLYKNFDAGTKDAFGPNEIHAILSFMTNIFLGVGNVTYFTTHASWIDIIEDVVYNNMPVGISGKFSGLNHIVLLVGAAYKELSEGNKPSTLQVPDYLIIDDPFGKTYEYDKGLSGNDIWIPFNRCIEDFKSLTNANFKFAHRFIKPDHLGIK